MQCMNLFNGPVDIGWGAEALAIGHDKFDLRNVDYVVQFVETPISSLTERVVRRAGVIYGAVTDSRISKESQKGESVRCIRFRRFYFYRFIIRSSSKCATEAHTYRYHR